MKKLRVELRRMRNLMTASRSQMIGATKYLHLLLRHLRMEGMVQAS